ncbi:hypothetical protein AURANDRAFT_32885 [Aureococcus anophagefferens]|uniref:Coatomer subunit zeta n=1 Tax=Aureococcus anophagefferens TaxID=44056 RepID=F0YL05_AURAN|nr:hypothetical protein AURANDRAFT_32885 [Aureococcus anophagefferens]EGB04231.1 hypothetical protein AURANDRAFT_32885 [Aureococcus anophagefferens]|eukprot:XP_009041082.1 hypothetical protein AURANDRAFT_32885 [Aureococcus anophagefferens]
MGSDALVPSILAVLLLDSEGNRIIAKYYQGFQSCAVEQGKFEAKLFKKTKNTNTTRSDADVIILFRSVQAIFRCGADTRFYVLGAAGENEIILNMVLDGLFEALHLLLRGQLESRALLDNLETVMLAVDELASVDGGVILETDAQSISNRVMMRGVEGTQPITDMSMSQAIASAKDQLFKS